MYLDRDFISTREGLLFCVVGCVHPRDRVIAYLKYVPVQNGKWIRGDKRYQRTMKKYTVPMLLDNINSLRKNFPQYVYKSKVLGVEMSAVPRRCIAYHYKPTTKLTQLLLASSKDELEEKVSGLILKLSDISGVKVENFGVTGSILLGIHSQQFSDMDIVVYGQTNVELVQKSLMSLLDSETQIRPFLNKTPGQTKLHWALSHHITMQEAEWFAARKWYRGTYMDSEFSILPVKLPQEVQERYGDLWYRFETIIEGTAIISDIKESYFLPSIYGLEDIHPASLSMISHLVSYDGFYSGIFKVGDAVRFCGKLERVLNKKSGEQSWRIVIGSPEAKGLDYVRPIL
ncbi:MAG: hypothetical protein QXI32_02550 [Candidatus Bathyarchaeia archaeon]